jgi:aldehyde dehydrogenase (NAD+)
VRLEATAGIANVNIGTSGVKSAASAAKRQRRRARGKLDAWKAYMRRQTVTVNWSRKLPLAWESS